jgi:hypothetical protein
MTHGSTQITLQALPALGYYLLVVLIKRRHLRLARRHENAIGACSSTNGVSGLVPPKYVVANARFCNCNSPAARVRWDQSLVTTQRHRVPRPAALHAVVDGCLVPQNLESVSAAQHAHPSCQRFRVLPSVSLLQQQSEGCVVNPHRQTGGSAYSTHHHSWFAPFGFDFDHKFCAPSHLSSTRLHILTPRDRGGQDLAVLRSEGALALLGRREDVLRRCRCTHVGTPRIFLGVGSESDRPNWLMRHAECSVKLTPPPVRSVASGDVRVAHAPSRCVPKHTTRRGTAASGRCS